MIGHLLVLSAQSKEIHRKISNWGISNSENRASIDPIYPGKGKRKVIVAVIDTGIDENHTYLQNNISAPKGTGIDFSNSKIDYQPEDIHGHGTHVAGIIKSVFPHVGLFILKYYGMSSSGQENLDATIKALEYAVKMNVDIINYSGGGPESSQREYNILKRAQKKGILVIAAAGNEHSNIDKKKYAYYPASYRLDNIIVVTAHDQQGSILPSSNWGRKSVDISAPGLNIVSSLPYNRVGTMTGTSQATAFVSGVAALIKAHFNYNYKKIKSIILKSVKKKQTMERLSKSGGLLNAKKAFNLASQSSK